MHARDSIISCMHSYIKFLAVGVSLKLQGVTISNNSLVDFHDLLYRTADEPDPSNDRALLHDAALLCVTDLVDCCRSPLTVHGDWYYPDGSVVQYDGNLGKAVFRRNRGPNEVRNG